MGSGTACTVWASRRADASSCTQSTEGDRGGERGKEVCFISKEPKSPEQRQKGQGKPSRTHWPVCHPTLGSSAQAHLPASLLGLGRSFPLWASQFSLVKQKIWLQFAAVPTLMIFSSRVINRRQSKAGLWSRRMAPVHLLLDLTIPRKVHPPL